MTNFETLQHIIKGRRSSKPALMNGKKIDNSIIQQLLELADWAPTHGHTEPWRFVVYSGDTVQQFCNDHAELYKANTPEGKFLTANYEKLKHQGDNLSHIILVYMKRGNNPKIPALEEMSAVACAVENFLLGASTLNIAVLWGSGGMTHHPAMKNYLGLAEEDIMMGLLYLGYTDEPVKEGKRIVPLEEKIIWK
ncbi:nitroreductase [Panacibacter ginsenosidivorans]|uniref:Nitroreductase n=1 Tax=Panacibacter ginsenosidivorans TaxID=1813871 RepID=A0A5B8VCK6_9BACT|nr:nitroreductase [Panacibacter ginsenosidivorans]QEC68733.1 nitroreductase [Panacibacter ginsenosidivorans]